MKEKQQFFNWCRCTVKPEIFACPLFRKFRDLDKFTKIMGREYSNGNRLLSTCISNRTQHQATSNRKCPLNSKHKQYNSTFCNKSISKLKVLVNKLFDLHGFHITVV